jgi:hypothetical protein
MALVLQLLAGLGLACFGPPHRLQRQQHRLGRIRDRITIGNDELDAGRPLSVLALFHDLGPYFKQRGSYQVRYDDGKTVPSSKAITIEVVP